MTCRRGAPRPSRRQPEDGAETEEELRLAADIIGFGFHALDALGQAMAPDLPLKDVLSLRGSAVNLNRQSHRSQRKLDQLRRDRPGGRAESRGRAWTHWPVLRPLTSRNGGSQRSDGPRSGHAGWRWRDRRRPIPGSVQTNSAARPGGSPKPSPGIRPSRAAGRRWRPLRHKPTASCCKRRSNGTGAQFHHGGRPSTRGRGRSSCASK